MRADLIVVLFTWFLAAAAAASAFGLSPKASPEYCYYELRRSDEIVPFGTGNTTAIHLGNTRSCIAGYGGRRLPDVTYKLCIPSWVAFTDNGTLVGDAALHHAAVSPGTAVSGFKRVLGLRVGNEAVKREMELVPYKFVPRLGRCGIRIESEQGEVKDLFPEQVAGLLMSELKQMAEARLGRPIRYAVITVPMHYYFDQRDILAASAGGLYCGFRAAKVVDEQIAAAAAYGLHKNEAVGGDGKVILVFHLGGRTTHATKFRLFQDGVALLLAARYDAYLGGDDFTARVVDHFAELIKAKHHGGRRDVELRELWAECERAKKALSEQQETRVSIGVNISEPLTRAKFEELNADLLARAMGVVEQVVARGEGDTIDEIILVGGSVRIPKVGQLLKDYFHGRKKPMIMEEDAVIRGAALLSRPESVRYVSECDR